MPKTDSVSECRGCTEKNRRLDDAIRLIKRGVIMLRRTWWELGETDSEWQLAAESFLTAEKFEAEYLRTHGRTE